MLTTNNKQLRLKDKVLKYTDESVAMCYQCGKCSAGCPLADEMDFAPNLILRMLQLDIPELEEKILGSMAIWLCLSCETCVTRCPKEVDFPLIMDYLRAESIRQNKVNPKAKDIISFHRTFLNSVRSSGRLHEVGLIAGYKLRSGHYFQDVDVAPKMFMNGLLNIFPHKIQNTEAIRRIFEKTIEAREELLVDSCLLSEKERAIK